MSKIQSIAKFAMTLYTHSLIRYMFVGGTTFIIDESILILLHGKLGVGVALSTTISYIVAFAYNFSLNRWWAFGATANKALRKHIAPYSILFTFNLLTAVILVSLASRRISYVLAKLFVVILQTVWNYYIYKNFIFTGEKEAPVSEIVV